MKGLKAALWPNPLFHGRGNRLRERRNVPCSLISQKSRGSRQCASPLTAQCLPCHDRSLPQRPVQKSRVCKRHSSITWVENQDTSPRSTLAQRQRERSWSGTGLLSLLLSNQLGHTEQVPSHGLCPCCASAWTTLFQNRQVVLSPPSGLC